MTSRLLLVAVASLGLVQGQAPTFRAGIEKVRVDVLVTRGGQPVGDLKPDDFEVFDNGVPQHIDGYGAFEEIPLNVVMSVDASASVAGERADLLRGACRELLRQVRENDQVGLVVFGDAVVIRSRLTRDLASVKAAVDAPLPPGQTSLIDAAQASLVLAESEPGRALVIVFSDGLEVSSYLPPQAVLDTAQRTDAVVYGIVVRGATRPHVLGEVAEASGGRVFEIASPLEIAPAFKKVLDEFRQRYLLSYTPSGVPSGGWHKLKVRVKRQDVAIKARPGYFR